MGAGKRIDKGIERGPKFEIEFDGQPIYAHEGETVAAALIAAGIDAFRHTAKLGTPRGVFCGMGVCFDCLTTIDGVPNIRACITEAQPGMKVETQRERTWSGGQ